MGGGWGGKLIRGREHGLEGAAGGVEVCDCGVGGGWW
jgi:hypothetical protein